MTPDEYARLDADERACWVRRTGPATTDEEQLVLDDTHMTVRAEVANNHRSSERLLRAMYDREPDPVLREVIATNPAAPLDLLESVAVSRHIGASLVAYSRRANLSETQQRALGAAAGRRPPEQRALGEFMRSLGAVDDER